MTSLSTGCFVALALVALPSPATAQPTTKWDGASSFGLMWGEPTKVAREPYSDDEPDIAFNFDLGRYWGTHFKTDVGLTLTPERTFYESTTGLVPGAYFFTTNDRSLSLISGAATYQFFENDFMHPYVSAGAQAGWSREHRVRPVTTYTANRVQYTIPELDERTTSALVRPFVAAGSKSYFNERTFIKSELLVAAGPRGFSHATLRIGFGADF
jgi:hypothetical protein